MRADVDGQWIGKIILGVGCISLAVDADFRHIRFDVEFEFLAQRYAWSRCLVLDFARQSQYPVVFVDCCCKHFVVQYSRSRNLINCGDVINHFDIEGISVALDVFAFVAVVSGHNHNGVGSRSRVGVCEQTFVDHQAVVALFAQVVTVIEIACVNHNIACRAGKVDFH